MFAPSLLSTLLLTYTVVSATPVATVNKLLITLPISRRVNATSLRGLYQHDLKRAQAFKAHGKSGSAGAQLDNTPATNEAVLYIAEVGVGSPATNCKCSYRVVHPLLIHPSVIRQSHHRHWEVTFFLSLTICCPNVLNSSSIALTLGSGQGKVMSQRTQVTTLETKSYVPFHRPVSHLLTFTFTKLVASLFLTDPDCSLVGFLPQIIQNDLV